MDSNTIDITINGTLHENVDTADGVVINLGAGYSDRVVMDDRVDLDLAIMFAEIIELVGERDNQWKIGFKPLEGGNLNTSPDFDPTLDDGLVAGRINDNVTFAGVRTVMGSDGDDHFNVVTNFAYHLNIRGRAGNDLLRFVDRPASQVLTPTDPTINTNAASSSNMIRGRVIGYGGGGNDRFVFRDGSYAAAEGGLGFDTLDYSLYEFKTSVILGDEGNERMEAITDRIILNFATVRTFGIPIGRSGGILQTYTTLPKTRVLNFITSIASRQLTDLEATIEFGFLKPPRI